MSSGNLVQLIKKIAMDAVRAAKMCDYVTGVVTSEDPLKVKITNSFEIGEEFLMVPQSMTDHEVEVTIKKAKLDSKGNKVTELVKSKNGNEYLKVVKEEVKEKRQKDMPTRLNARRKMMRKLNKVKDSDGKNIDVPAKLFNEIAPKYAGSNVGGYTRIVKAGPRRGDGAEVAVLQLI